MHLGEPKTASPGPREGIYPYAKSGDGSFIHILDYKKGSPVFCVGCEKEMVGRQGKKMVWHFAHKGGELSCSPESALHKAAKESIRGGYEKTKILGRPYELKWKCSSCSFERSLDLSAFPFLVTLEKSIAPGSISDLAFEGPRTFAVEVIVTHEMEDGARASYKKSGIPVFCVRPTWESLFSLFSGIAADEAFNCDPARCPSCIKIEGIRSRYIESFKSSIRAAQYANKREPEVWDHDADGNNLYRPLYLTLHETAKNLIRAGLTQSKKKPWVFYLNVHRIGSFYAYLGGTRQIPIWEDQRALIYRRLGSSSGLSDKLIDELDDFFVAHLKEHGVLSRKSFYEYSATTYYHELH